MTLPWASTSFLGTMNSEMPRVPGTSLPSACGILASLTARSYFFRLTRMFSEYSAGVVARATTPSFFSDSILRLDPPTWSLVIEVQFYFVLPLIGWWALRRTGLGRIAASSAASCCVN